MNQIHFWCICLWRCLWCNGYRRRIWTRRHEFKSWTWLIAFHIALIPLGKVWIQIFSLQLIVGQTRFFSLGEATSLGEGKLWIQTCQTLLKNWLCVISCLSGGLVNSIKYTSMHKVHTWIIMKHFYSSSPPHLVDAPPTHKYLGNSLLWIMCSI